MKKIYFITGASGVGKTTLVEGLKEKYQDHPEWTFLHFDSVGVPSPEDMEKDFGSGENWQKETTNDWVKKMVMEYENQNIIFEGQVNLDFIENAFQKVGFSDYRTILVDCSDEVMRERLEGERAQPELFTQDMINWRSFLRKQAEEKNIDVIETSDIEKSEVIEKFEGIRS